MQKPFSYVIFVYLQNPQATYKALKSATQQAINWQLALYNVDLFTNLLKSENAVTQCIINVTKAMLSSFITLHPIAGVFLVGNACSFTKMLAGNMLSLSDDIVTALSPSTTAIQLIAMLLISIILMSLFKLIKHWQQKAI